MPPPFKTLNDTFDFTPPATLAEWVARREQLRVQVQVATGLWPMPPRTPLNATVRELFTGDGYTVAGVHLESVPGHLVTGNLYRPARLVVGPRPAVLFAHGHWDDGRFHDAGPEAARAAVERGEEADERQARFFMQALPITLARLGFVVFQYDMVGYAESTTVPHRRPGGRPHPDGFADALAELRLQSLLGLQTWNSVRALDFLATLPDVDANRIGMTGGSGGGTQTFLLAAMDDRLAAAAPAVMVSVGMQGGCVCENASYLRLKTGNVELAALLAPKPLALTGANDWTREIMTRGLPELRRLYALHGCEQNVVAKAWVQFPHNYNRPAREFVYGFFRRHLQGLSGAVTEPAFEPRPPADLRVFDANHPRPRGEKTAGELRADFTRTATDQLTNLPAPERRRVVSAAWRAIVNADFTPTSAKVLPPPDGVGRGCVVWVGPAPMRAAALQALHARKLTVALPTKPEVGTPDPVFAGFTWGYNRPPLADFANAILNCVEQLRREKPEEPVTLIGAGRDGLAAFIAAVVAGDRVSKLAADLAGFRFESVTELNDSRLVPGALKYDGVPGLAEAFTQPAQFWNAPAGVMRGVRPTPPTPAELADWAAS